MNHQKFENLVHAYLDGLLSDNKSTELFSHLADCEECRILFHTSHMLQKIALGGKHTTLSSLDRRVLGKQDRVYHPTKPAVLLPWSSIRIGISLPAASSVAVLLIVLGLLVAPRLFGAASEYEAKQEIQTLEKVRAQYSDKLGIITWRDLSR